uniref:Uncharacterized protein n=1 Tax=Timema tahoe TaxID=61484 RepID=A0A7R9IS22_9NEOP|nr:unnamed protein product [Timema tahoe]
MAFGNSVGMQLQNMPLELALQLQSDIQALITRTRLDNLRSSSMSRSLSSTQTSIPTPPESIPSETIVISSEELQMTLSESTQENKVVRGEKASPGQISTLVDYMLDHRKVSAGRLCGMRGRLWTDLKYKARRHAALMRADHLKTGNKPKNEPALNDMEKKILTIIGPETAEDYCVADSLPERQEDLLKAIDGILVPSVEDDPPQLFLKELLEGPVEVVEQECDNPAYEEAGICNESDDVYETLLESRHLADAVTVENPVRPYLDSL